MPGHSSDPPLRPSPFQSKHPLHCPSSSALITKSEGGEAKKHTQEIPHLQLHLLHQFADVANVVTLRAGRRVLHREVVLNLAGHVAGKIHLPQPLPGADHVQDHGAGELVVARAGAVDGLKDVDTIPRPSRLWAGRDGCRLVSAAAKETRGACTSTFLQQHDPGKAVIQIPKVDARNPALVVELAVDVECRVCRNLHLPQALGRECGVRQRGRVLIAPWRAIRVAVAVVVTQEIFP